ncbi:MAG TPA: hypothetical protein VKH34_16975 [Vicinamibacterales bacterium]|nr:hypothetical protein [Vicinamibacterales bacterium]
MDPQLARSEYRIEKRRTDAVVTLVTNETVHGCLFTAAGSAHGTGAERIGDLLNSEPGFFPFEIHEAGGNSTVQYNRSHVVVVRVLDDEARRDAGYAVARSQAVSLLLTNGQRIEGEVRVYRPEGRTRTSDWTRQPEVFRYVEARDGTYIVNAAHIVAVTEVSGS